MMRERDGDHDEHYDDDDNDDAMVMVSEMPRPRRRTAGPWESSNNPKVPPNAPWSPTPPVPLPSSRSSRPPDSAFAGSTAPSNGAGPPAGGPLPPEGGVVWRQTVPLGSASSIHGARKGQRSEMKDGDEVVEGGGVVGERNGAVGVVDAVDS